jgi:hypothetical protein
MPAYAFGPGTTGRSLSDALPTPSMNAPDAGAVFYPQLHTNCKNEFMISAYRNRLFLPYFVLKGKNKAPHLNWGLFLNCALLSLKLRR